LVDHSAVDAYAFLVEAGGTRILYCGDFRSHGRIGKFLESLANHPLPSIDLMLLEVSVLRRSDDDLLTESAVSKRLFKIISQQKNITFIISSSQNISRIMSAYKACKRACKTLVIDTYTAWVLEQVGEVSEDIPVMEMEGIRVYVDFTQDEKLKVNSEYFGDFRQRLQQNRIKWAEMTANPSSFVYFGEMSSFRKINAFREGEGPVNVIYSQWLGYLDGAHNDYPGAEQISGFRNDSEINFEYAHTSGHASLKDLQSLAAALKPSLVVPINTKLMNYFGKSFDNVMTLGDGIPFALNLNSELAGVENGSEYTKFRANA
jgi:ribonuclease J